MQILDYLKRWSAPYSPFDPLELTEIWVEMDEVAKIMSQWDIHTLIDILSGFDITDEDYYFTLTDFLQRYMLYHGQNAYVVEKLFHACSGPRMVYFIEALAYSLQPDLSPLIIDLVNFDQLTKEEQLIFLGALGHLASPLSTSYLQTLKNNGTYDTEVMEEIDISLDIIKRTADPTGPEQH